jgi:hypothetical protein
VAGLREKLKGFKGKLQFWSKIEENNTDSFPTLLSVLQDEKIEFTAAELLFSSIVKD